MVNAQPAISAQWKSIAFNHILLGSIPTEVLRWVEGHHFSFLFFLIKFLA